MLVKSLNIENPTKTDAEAYEKSLGKRLLKDMPTDTEGFVRKLKSLDPKRAQEIIKELQDSGQVLPSSIDWDLFGKTYKHGKEALDPHFTELTEDQRDFLNLRKEEVSRGLIALEVKLIQGASPRNILDIAKERSRLIFEGKSEREVSRAKRSSGMISILPTEGVADIGETCYRETAPYGCVAPSDLLTQLLSVLAARLKRKESISDLGVLFDKVSKGLGEYINYSKDDILPFSVTGSVPPQFTKDQILAIIFSFASGLLNRKVDLKTLDIAWNPADVILQDKGSSYTKYDIVNEETPLKKRNIPQGVTIPSLFDS